MIYMKKSMDRHEDILRSTKSDHDINKKSAWDRDKREHEINIKRSWDIYGERMGSTWRKHKNSIMRSIRREHDI